MRFLLPLMLVVLTACSVPVVRQTLPVFNGKSVDYAVSWLGIPDKQYTFNGNDVYEWDNSYSHTYTRPRANMGFGIGSGGHYGMGVGFPLGDFGGYETETYTQRCQIKLIAKKGMVLGHEMYGDDNGCAKYAQRLRPLQAQVQGKAP